MSGRLSVVLHHHVPYLPPGEADWLYDAVADSWLPIIELCRRASPGLTLAISPLVLEMLADPRHRKACAARLEARESPSRSVFRALDGDLVGAWAALGRAGAIELVTTPATHAILPLMAGDRGGMRAQVQAAVTTHERHLGARPRGIWLAEAGYAPRIDAVLAEAGLEYFFVGVGAIARASSVPARGPFAPLRCPESGLVAFGETPLPAPPRPKMVRDVGLPRPAAMLRPYTHPSVFGRVLADGGPSDEQVPDEAGYGGPYDAAQGRKEARATGAALADLCRGAEDDPLFVAAWPADLFGRWWHAGVDFLAGLSGLVTPAQIVDEAAPLQIAWPAASTQHGGFGPWTAPTAAWLHHDLYVAAERMSALATKLRAAEGDTRRALVQAGRELMLARTSDWALLLDPDTPCPAAAVDVAVERVRDHLAAFDRLAEALTAGAAVDSEWLAGRERAWGPFTDLDPGLFAG